MATQLAAVVCYLKRQMKGTININASEAETGVDNVRTLLYLILSRYALPIEMIALEKVTSWDCSYWVLRPLL